MQETLITLRGIHRLSIAGCITVLLLAMTPSLAHRYQTAIDELEEAQAAFAEFDSSEVELFTVEEDHTITQVIHDVIAKDLKGDGGLVTAWSFRELVDEEVLPRIDPAHELLGKLEQPLGEMSLAAIREISTNADAHKPAQILIPNEQQLRQKLLALLVERLPKRFEQLSTDPTPREVTIQVRFQALRNEGFPRDYNTSVVGFFVECGLDDEEPWLLYGDVVAASSMETQVPSQAALLISVLPRCKSVWSEVHGLTPADAMQLLKGRKADTTADVVLMGFRFPKHVALLLGPLVTAILFLYLQLHVKHAVPRIQRHGWRTDDFPWIAFYLDRTSKLVTLGTLVFLPMLSCGLLTYSEWQLGGEFPWTIAGCAVFCTLSGATTLVRVRTVPPVPDPAGSELANETLPLAA